mmetsp:Transcript_8176/g.12297  ORF Transcript_8176/g.12297 Transcript_8176/m.12297 type:complete len:318 (+) Transcript_8176:101-1054(+)
MVVGYSLSPGGLLFPWHIGTLTALSHHQYLTEKNPIAGSSAGAIAVASHASHVKPEIALDATIRMSNRCRELGQARGNLLPLLSLELDELLEEDVHDVFNEREGYVGLAYRELFPMNRPVLDTYFDSKDHVIDSVCNSSMFPFFSTNFPCRFSRRKSGFLPRIVVDGYFAVDRSRFGCPCFNTMDHPRKSTMNEVQDNGGDGSDDNDDGSKPSSESALEEVERTISIAVFPHNVLKIDAFETHDQISPQIENPDDMSDQISNLFRLATECGTAEEYHDLYEKGWKDAERWISEENRRGFGSTDERRSYYAKYMDNSI